MTNLTAPLLRVLPTMLFCLTLSGAADAVASDGSVVGWGDDSYGQSTPPDTVNGSGTATHISAGVYHSCAIQAGTGRVVCWGNDNWGRATPPDSVNGVLGTATEITAGVYHNCAIQEGTGIVICWGANANGEATPPDAVNGIAGTATAIARNCAIQAGTGKVVCWGDFYFGQATPPDTVNGVSGTATDVVAANAHSCAIQAGTDIVVCWGRDDEGQATPPNAVNGVSGTAIDIAVGARHSCAIQAETGDVVCWGDDYDALGRHYFGQSTPPDTVNGVSGTANAIAAGDYHSCAIQAGTGDVVCWGSSSDGSGDYTGQSKPPRAVNGKKGTATDIAAGGNQTLAIALPGPPAPLARAQQMCVNEMNKNGERVDKRQLRENERCLRDFQSEKLVGPMAFNTCTTADQKGRVRKAEDRTEMREENKCDPLDVRPPFAYTNSATVNTVAVDGALALTYVIFGGPPVLDDTLVTRAEDKETAKCQFEMLKRADKLENTVLKEINKAKRKALKDETVDSDAALEAKLQAVFTSNDKITRTQARLVKQVDNKCADLQAAPDAIFPGECGEGSLNLNEVEACVIAAARCEACVTINAFDDLNLDCDWADDHALNRSCPAAGRKAVRNPQQLTNADCFPSSVPDSASTWAKMCIGLANSAPDMAFTPADYQGMPEDCKPLVNPICR